MLTLHLIGHVYVTDDGVPARLSPKAVALIVYLALERQPQHRERLAELLWPTVEARKNLRVELARIRAAGLDIFPRSNKLLYLENFTTDLQNWLVQTHPLPRDELSKWLAVLRGFPLSGLEDLGDPALQTWLEQQRFELQAQIEQRLSHVYQDYEQRGQVWATRQISQRAAAVGYELSPEEQGGALAPKDRSPTPAPVLSSLSPEAGSSQPEAGKALPSDIEQLLNTVRAGHPQIVMVHGPLGIGKSHRVDQALKNGGWLKLHAHSTRTPRLVLASLAQQLLPHLDERGQETLDTVLRQPGTPEEDVIKLATVLADLPGPVALVLDHAQTAAVELASLMEFVLRSPSTGRRALLILSRHAPLQVRLCRALLSRFPPEQCAQIEVLPLSLEQVLELFERRWTGAPDAHHFAAELLQVSEGNPLHLLIHLNHLEAQAALTGQPLGLNRSRAAPTPQMRWPSLIREKYQSEIDGWPLAFRSALEQLSVINGSFDLALAQAALGLKLEASWDLVQEAVERHVLLEWPAHSPALDLLTLKPLSMAAGGRQMLGATRHGESLQEYVFRSEGLRVALGSLLGQQRRQQTQQRLIAALSRQPGLALYYAERAGLDERRPALLRAYQQRLPEDSPLRRRAPGPTQGAFPSESRPAPIHPPAWPGQTPAYQVWQGYLVSRSDRGWLNVSSQGRGGRPHTLTLKTAPLHTPPLRDRSSLLQGGGCRQTHVKLVWRLDVYQSGEQFHPEQVPFALRVALPGATRAFVFAPGLAQPYQEEASEQVPGAEPRLGEWMEHRLSWDRAADSAELTFELAVRALDVSLTVASFEVDGQERLASGG